MKKGLLYSTLVGLVMLFGTTMLSAQNEFMLAEQMFSRINKNPAATGNSLDIDVFCCIVNNGSDLVKDVLCRL